MHCVGGHRCPALQPKQAERLIVYFMFQIPPTNICFEALGACRFCLQAALEEKSEKARYLYAPCNGDGSSSEEGGGKGGMCYKRCVPMPLA